MMAPQNPKLVAEVERMVLARVAAGRIEVPVMRVVATQCLAILREPNFHHRTLLAKIEAEPMLAALVLRAANTAANGGSTPKLDVAVNRMGASRLTTLVLEFASREVFQSRDRRIAAANQAIWEHSIVVAHMCRDLGTKLGAKDADAYYLAGLLHDIGKPIVAAMLLDAERRMATDVVSWLDLAVWTKTIEAIHRQVGIAVTTTWKLPDEITAGVRDCTTYDCTRTTSIANLVKLANALAKREGYTAGPVDKVEVEATIAAGQTVIGIDEVVLSRLVGDVRQRLAETG